MFETEIIKNYRFQKNIQLKFKSVLCIMTEKQTHETYYEKNKETIEKKRHRKVQCAKCLRTINFASLYMHNKSKKCIRDYNLRMLEENDEIEIVNEN